MTEFNERIEGEIKTHEKEMLRKVVIKKYGDRELPERIRYVMETYPKESQPAGQAGWTADEMFAKLTELGLNGNNSVADVKNIFNDTSHSFPAKGISE